MAFAVSDLLWVMHPDMCTSDYKLGDTVKVEKIEHGFVYFRRLRNRNHDSLPVETAEKWLEKVRLIPLFSGCVKEFCETVCKLYMSGQECDICSLMTYTGWIEARKRRERSTC